MKRLQRYYYLVATPVLFLAFGAIYFFQEIANTVRGNPHPQINYIIFMLIICGSALMLMHIQRINREGALIKEFFASVKKQESGNESATRRWLDQVKQKNKHDVIDILELVLDHHGKALGPVQHSAIESEIAHFQSQQQRRLLLAQFLSGLMVGMGLLGTFIGLLGALEEIGKLIGSFTTGPGMTDPVAAVTELVARLTGPMKAMGIAFSASLFGVLGSLIMTMLMVFVKGANSELLSLLQSRVSRLTDISANPGFNESGVQPLQNALSELATHSPLLQGLTIALDQSERRVRQLLAGLQELTAQVQQTAQIQSQTLQVMTQQNMLQQQNEKVLEQARLEINESLQIQLRAEQRHTEGHQILSQMQMLVRETLLRQEPFQESLRDLQQAFTEESRAQQVLWQDSLQAGQKQLQTQVHEERVQWLSRLQDWGQQQQQTQQHLLQWVLDQDEKQANKNIQSQQIQDSLLLDRKTWESAFRTLSELMQQASLQLTGDSQQRNDLIKQTRDWLDEKQARHEQILHYLKIQDLKVPV